VGDDGRVPGLRPPILSALVRRSCARPWLTLAVAAALCVAAAVYVAGHFSMTSDTTKLISDKVPWRQNEIAMDRAFQRNGDITVVVVDGATPELAEQGAAALAARLQARKDLLLSVQRPDGGPFFAQEGLLFLPTAEVVRTTDQLVSAQPFLAPMAADPSLRGVMSSVSNLADGVAQGQADLASVDRPVASLAGALRGAAAGRAAPFSWQKMIAGDGGGLQSPTRRFVIVHPKLDYGALMPGVAASQAIRAEARALGLDGQHGVTVRLTGSVPLSDEEFASLEDGAWMVAAAMLLAVLVMLWLAVRSTKLVLAILMTTLIGLVLTAALGLAAVGRFNLISVAFIPLFVGLGVDFGIQFSVRFRAERLVHEDLGTALESAAAGIGGSLALAAAAIVLGFLAFLPTDYIGVSELGVISGLGMVLGFVLNLTLLPALIVLLSPSRLTGPVGSAKMAPLDRFLVERRKLVLWAFGLSMAGSVVLLPLVRFDFNPFHLRNTRGEAMATLLDIMRDPTETPNTIDVLAPSQAAADRLAQRLAALPEVAQTITLSSFVPEDQTPKLAAIGDAELLLDPTLNPLETAPTPSDAETIQALRGAAAKLRAAAGSAATAPAGHARDLAAALETLAAGPPAGRARAADVLIPPLKVTLDQIRAMLTARPVTLQTLPPELTADWLARDGRARIQVSPAGDSNDNATLKRFSAAVRRLAPDASGAPISIQEAGHTISGAFIRAGLLSLATIFVLLFVALRSLREVAFTLAPIVLAGFLTLGTCVLIGQPINFANIIAFPLLFGVGVAFHIYFVLAWRGGATDLLQSSLARGVFFSALTTGTAFGSLIFSSHPGTSSMGKILMISLIWTLVAALIFEPALLGRPPPPGERRT
jgi:hopanoid biosynthesis associated RND transporter like protein HpnN